LSLAVYLNSSSGSSLIPHWRHIKIFWDKKVTENVEPMPDLLENFGHQKLQRMTIFEGIF